MIHQISIIIIVVIITWQETFDFVLVPEHRHSHLNCLTTPGSTWDLGNCLLFVLLICVGIEWETWCCGSTIIDMKDSDFMLKH